MADIRFRGKEHVNKEQCRELIKELIDNLEDGDTKGNIENKLDNSDILEEEFMGKIRAFSILLDPESAEKLWSVANGIEACTPILMTNRRWEDE